MAGGAVCQSWLYYRTIPRESSKIIPELGPDCKGGGTKSRKTNDITQKQGPAHPLRRAIGPIDTGLKKLNKGD